VAIQNYKIEEVTQPNKYTVDEFLPLCLGSLSESVWKRVDFDIFKLRMLISLFVENPDPENRMLFVVKYYDKVVGLLAAVVDSDSLVGKSMARELMWYIAPTHRRSKVSLELINAFENWAKGRVQCVCMCHFSNKTGDILSKVYRKRGYTPMEVSYLKEFK